MSGAPADLVHLVGLYAATDDPWRFRSSAYEDARLRAVADALSRPRYAHALELGCGNGELARRLAPRCDAYTGLDAVPAALEAARAAVPAGRFVEGFLPCELPAGEYDLIVLSEVLYFLSRADAQDLAARIDAAHPGAEVVTVTWRGPTGHALSGDEAFVAYADATPRAWRTAQLSERCRIATFVPRTVPA